MRGEVLHYDPNSGQGFITGQDGNRYAFVLGDFRQAITPQPGASVDFKVEGATAREVFVLGAQAQFGAPNQHYAPQGAPQGGYAQPGYGQVGYAQPGYAPAWRGPGEPELGLWGYFTRALTAKYASFGGRARRKEYWGFVLFAALLSLIPLLIMLVGASTSDFATMQRLTESNPQDFSAILNTFSPLLWIGSLLLIVYALALIIPGLAVTVRRFHDVGMSGWLYLLCIVLGLIPLVGFIATIFAFVVTVLDSKPMPNKWGNPPK